MIRQTGWRVAFRVVLGLCGSAAQAFGQGEPARTRPKIGLALGGGSALGMAHVGVLKWFEEHHIPVDYIAGTSIGGLVGGFYAVGMTPAEMHTLLQGIRWNEVLQGTPPYEALTFRRKEDERNLPNRLEVGLRPGVMLPSGLDPAQPVGMLLSRISLPYSTLPSFDALPIPFRCMAMDLGKGDAIALKDGSLATALRATMAIPGLFTPVERDGRLLADAGILNNLPTETVKEMGADIVIAVDLYGPFQDGRKRRSLLDVLVSAHAITIYNNERRSLLQADIVLNPALAQFTEFDFNRVDTFVERGYQAAAAKAKIIERLALDDAEWRAYVAQRQSRQRTAAPTPAFVEVEGGGERGRQELQKRLRPFTDAPLNLPRLEKELTAITGAGRYESFQYEQTRRSGRDGLLIHAQEKSYGPPFLKFGVEVDGADTDNIRFNVAARLTGLNAGAPGAETRTDLRLGSDREAAFEYYRPLGESRWFLAPRASYLEESRERFQSGARAAIERVRSEGAALDLGYSPGRQSEMRIGYRFRHLDESVRTGSPLLSSLEGSVSALSLRFALDGQDSPVIPTHGTLLTMRADWYFTAPGAPRSFPTAEIRLNHFTPLHKGDLWFGMLRAGTTFGAQAGPLQQFTLGGPLRLGAYSLNEFVGSDSLLLSTGYLHRLAELPPFLGGKLLLGGWYEFGGAFPGFAHARYRSDLSVGLVAETLLGPVALGYSFGEGGRSNAYFSIGRLWR